MKPRYIAALSSLPDAKFFEALAEGMTLVWDNARRFLRAAELLAQQEHGRASHALHLIGEEEAAKYLILLDAVRCPVQPPQRRASQLRRFNDHLAKGIYVRAYAGRPATVAEVLTYIEPLRASHYLDGPNDIDWIFRNEVAQEREEALYVDYVDTDDGPTWWMPGGLRDDPKYSRWWTGSDVLALVGAMHGANFGTVDALGIIANVWRPLDWPPDTHFESWRQTSLNTLRRFELAGLLSGSSDQHSRIIDSWLFPLHNVEMSLVKVDIAQLRERQQEGVWEF